MMRHKAGKGKAKPRTKTRETKRQTVTPPLLRRQYSQEEVHRLLGDQRTGVSIPATSVVEGAAGIFWD